MSATSGRTQSGWATFADRAPQVAVIGIALSGSVTNILDLCAQHGVRGLEAWSVASVIDLTAMIAAYERQRDRAIRRPRKGLISFPTLLLVGDICLSLAMQLAIAHQGPWGHIISIVALVSMLMLVFMLERRAAHEERIRRDAGTKTGTEQAQVPGTAEYLVPGTETPGYPVPGTAPAAGTEYPVPGAPGTGTRAPAPGSTAPVPPALPPAAPPARTVAAPPPSAGPRLHSADHLPADVARLMRAHKRQHNKWMPAKDLRRELSIAYSLALQLRRDFIADEEAA